jgi:hypothetical protein
MHFDSKCHLLVQEPERYGQCDIEELSLLSEFSQEVLAPFEISSV